MSRVRGKDTRPELRVRRLVFAMGYRYRLHDGTLPGRPDLVFRARRKAIFVHGCFWHRHARCALTRTPKSRVRFWSEKFAGNLRRDQRNLRALRARGWRVLVVWECQVGQLARPRKRIKEFLDA